MTASVKVLGIETATIEVGAAIVTKPGKSQRVEVLASRRVRPGRLQAETLHPLIVEVANDAAMALSELDAIAVDIGPGLFTGLRVGITTAKALGFGLDIPVVGVTSTEILHFGARESASSVLAVIDMRRGEVVYARSDHPDVPILCRPAEAIAMIAEDDALNGALIVGDGVARYKELFEPIIIAKNLHVASDQQLAPDPSSLGELAILALAEGRYLRADDLEPLYLRDADAKINWTTRDLSKVEPR